MTQEQKLLKLLQIAVENGFKLIDISLSGNIKKVSISNGNTINELNSLWVLTTEKGAKYYFSLNDLVCNFEESEVSFIEALFIELSKKGINDFVKIPQAYTKSFRYVWVDTPPSQRLDWLFEIFNHLTHK